MKRDYKDDLNDTLDANALSDECPTSRGEWSLSMVGLRGSSDVFVL